MDARIPDPLRQCRRAERALTKCKARLKRAQADAARANKLIADIVYALQRSEAENEALRAVVTALKGELPTVQATWTESVNDLLVAELAKLREYESSVEEPEEPQSRGTQTFVQPRSHRKFVKVPRASNLAVIAKQPKRPASAPPKKTTKIGDLTVNVRKLDTVPISEPRTPRPIIVDDHWQPPQPQQAELVCSGRAPPRIDVVLPAPAIPSPLSSVRR